MVRSEASFQDHQGPPKYGFGLFEKGGLINRHLWDTLPALKARALDGDHEDNGMPCEMLQMDDEGNATCLIEEKHGRQFKPGACLAHEFTLPDA